MPSPLWLVEIDAPESLCVSVVWSVTDAQLNCAAYVDLGLLGRNSIRIEFLPLRKIGPAEFIGTQTEGAISRSSKITGTDCCSTSCSAYSTLLMKTRALPGTVCTWS